MDVETGENPKVPVVSLDKIWVRPARPVREGLEEAGCRFVDKRKMLFPLVSGEELLPYIGNKDRDAVKGVIGLVSGYLKGAPITDSFGSDHRLRRRWRKALKASEGENDKGAYEYYQKFNQLRRGRIGAVSDSLELLGLIIKDSGQKDKLSRLGDELEEGWMEIKSFLADERGVDMYDLKSDEEKIAVTQRTEDIIIRIFERIACLDGG